jgi:L-ascorbate metabolism protein UlaG (beta-lactamase superfamily)
MSLDITFLGHSGFLLSDGTARVVLDPYLTGNPLARQKPDDITCDTIVLTHGHEDHFGDTVAIAQRNDAVVMAAHEVCTFCGEQGHAKVDPGNTGGTIETAFGSVSFTPAFHSSSYQGRYMGQPMGVVLYFKRAGVTFYHAGDTALFSDMKLIGELYRPDIAALPCGDRFTMGPALAARAAEWIKPKVAIPIHYATFPLLTSDLDEFKPAGVKVQVIEPGATWRYE